MINFKVDADKFEKAYFAAVAKFREFIRVVYRRDSREPASRADIDLPPEMQTPMKAITENNP